ncbi:MULTISPECIES: hypothetical protein [unclassified Aeromonas]|uniref:hypothetical protein n=1 Tax=unclassified Aeromonas TaxID=257493 RepID=UPI001112E7E5|nr:MULTISPECIES: hypothetical protein [unclassified Aeromonas]
MRQELYDEFNSEVQHPLKNQAALSYVSNTICCCLNLGDHHSTRIAGKTRVKNPVEMRVKTPEQILLVVLAEDPTLMLKQVAEQVGKYTTRWNVLLLG